MSENKVDEDFGTKVAATVRAARITATELQLMEGCILSLPDATDSKDTLNATIAAMSIEPALTVPELHIGLWANATKALKGVKLE